MEDDYPIMRSNNPFVDFTSDNAPEANSYMQYDKTTGDQINCRFPQKGPMEIALANTFSSSNAPTIQTYTTQAVGNCNISPTPNGNTKELYNDITKELTVFNQLYFNNLSTFITNTAELVPSMRTITKDDSSSENMIFCEDPSEAGVMLVPYMLEYILNDNYSKFVRFCMTEANVKKLSFDFDYYIYSYYNGTTESNCQVSSCSTIYAPFLGYNINTDPVNSSDPIHSNERTTTYIIFAVGGFILILLISIVIAYAMKIDKKKLPRVTKSTYNNPVFSKK